MRIKPHLLKEELALQKNTITTVFFVRFNNKLYTAALKDIDRLLSAKQNAAPIVICCLKNVKVASIENTYKKY